MNGLQIIYMIGALAVGFICGMICELLTANETFQKINKKNERLELEVEYLRKSLQEAHQLEIVENDGEPKNYFTPF